MLCLKLCLLLLWQTPQYSTCLSLICRLKSAVNTWNRRFENLGLTHHQQPVVPYVKSLPVAMLPLSSWILAACDFHCTDVVKRVVSDNPSLDLDEAELKRLIWQFSGSVNVRERRGPHAQQPGYWRWRQVQDSFLEAAKAIVRKNVRVLR